MNIKITMTLGKKTEKIIFSTRPGFSLLEALLTLSIFALLISVFAGGLTFGQQSIHTSSSRVQANFLAEEGLEAVRSMRDEDFGLLTSGTHGLDSSSGVWNFSGTSDVTDIFTRTVTVSDIDSETKSAVVNVSWQQSAVRSGTVELNTRLTNWKTYNPTQADQLTVDISNTSVGGQGNSEILGVTIEDTGIEDIIVVSTEISWTGVPANRMLEEIIIDGGSVWTGSDASGSTQDISDFTLVLGAGIYPINLLFSGAISGISVSVAFNMEDGSIKTVNFEPGVPPDIIPPNDITDLAVSNPSTSSLDISWTAPGDDDNVGTATSYDIRYSDSPINDGNWDSAVQVSNEPTPGPAGTNENMTVPGLLSNVTYYFAMKTSDEVPNVSGLSNVASGATLGAPQANYLVVNTLGAILSPDSKEVIGITLQNSGPANITISSMTVSWTGVPANRRIREITIGGASVWSGNNNTGALEDITDVTLISGALAIPLDSLRFSNTINGINISIDFNMSDGSTKTVSGIVPI